MKKFLTIIAIFFSISLLAQNENDALRYSLINYNGTARFTSLSGAYGAVGADFSSLSQNPAGLALYRKSEFMVTPVLSSNNTTTYYMALIPAPIQSEYSNKNAGHLGNIGFVYSERMGRSSAPVVQMQFAFGVNMMSSFNSSMIISGYNKDNSLMTTYVNDLNDGKNFDEFGSGLAYDANLIFEYNDGSYGADMYYGQVQQTKYIETRGSSSEFVIGIGSNVADKLFLGCTFAFPYIRYDEESILTETDEYNTNEYFNSFDRREFVETRGNGFNFKAGFILMPVNFLRFGGAVHTKTNYYNMSDYYGASIDSYFDEGYQDLNEFVYSPNGYFDYELKTPLRLQGNVAVIIGNIGLISADYEYIDYSEAYMSSYDYSFITENENIENNFTSTNNLRFGAEVKFRALSLRGGYSLYESPYKNDNDYGIRTGYSCGLGFREKDYFIDFSYQHMNTQNSYYLYNISPISISDIKTNLYSLSMGVRF